MPTVRARRLRLLTAVLALGSLLLPGGVAALAPAAAQAGPVLAVESSPDPVEEPDPEPAPEPSASPDPRPVLPLPAPSRSPESPAAPPTAAPSPAAPAPAPTTTTTASLAPQPAATTPAPPPSPVPSPSATGSASPSASPSEAAPERFVGGAVEDLDDPLEVAAVQTPGQRAERILQLILLGAVVLGVAGAAGLHLTREERA